MMPNVGDRVKILKGRSAGKKGVVTDVDESRESCLSVLEDHHEYAHALTPDEVEVISPEAAHLDALELAATAAWRVYLSSRAALQASRVAYDAARDARNSARAAQ